MYVIDSLEKFDLAYSAKLIVPLNSVPVHAVDAFRGKLTFAPSGLAHSEYSMLDAYLTPDQLPLLFSYFGIESAKFSAIRDKFCGAGTGKCFAMKGALCDPTKCKENGPPST